MIPRHFLAMSMLAACILTQACEMASATESWVPTETRATDVTGVTPGPIMEPDEALHVVVSLRLRNKEEFDTQTADIQAGKLPPLTPEEFERRYAPTADQTNTVVAYLVKCGFANIAVADSGLQISADGTARDAVTAFNVELRHFNLNGRDAYANTSDAQVPAILGDLVQSIQGLQNIHAARILH